MYKIEELKEEYMKRLTLTDEEKNYFKKYKNGFNVTARFFYKNDKLYNLKIVYKYNNIYYQLKENKKIIYESKNNKTILNKIIKIYYS